MDPHNVSEIIDSVIELGKKLGKEHRANEITKSLKKRIENIRKINKIKNPKILAIEWIEPFFTAGHWVPEMIQIAGGKNMISKTGEHSRRLNMDEISKSNPDIIILMPCGFDTHRIVTEYAKILEHDESWNALNAVRNNQIFAVDANSFFSKPSIRTVEGIEILAKIIHPEIFGNLKVSDKSFVNIGKTSS